ncbi:MULTISPECIES: phage distal tail protein [unclassified Streptomyces]|uniref:phage distal tail protein n=1 Tax=unclassified Streptomyces TaxID=2593676 RepID=UPI0006ADFF5E|nr:MULTISPECIES: phage tail domain-containing protein [unclassified Streptomyces]KOX33031.1 hypothetical protein ADL06_09805 [Streptomyces sp. NRRL F-6491]KOX49531.1 hypothetical protein ADL08_08500 [Streptomyces sp. NRRL F-6492]
MAELNKDFQIEVGGLLMGPGTPYVIADVPGFGTPDLRSQDVDSPAGDGVFPGVDYYGMRAVRIEAAIRTPGDPAAAADALAALHRMAATAAVRKKAGALTSLRVKWPGRPARRFYGRVRRAEAITTAQLIHGWVPLDLGFDALDSTVHDDVEQSLVLPLDISQDAFGFKAPVIAPITTGVSNPATRPGWMTNRGDLPAFPKLRISGPVANPRVWIAETGKALQLALTLGPGEYVEIDTRLGARWVVKNGFGSAQTALSTSSRLDQFQIPPGRSELRWTATDYTNTTRLAITWRDAYTAL